MSVFGSASPLNRRGEKPRADLAPCLKNSAGQPVYHQSIKRGMLAVGVVADGGSSSLSLIVMLRGGLARMAGAYANLARASVSTEQIGEAGHKS